jgi:hypothetical protein
MGTALIIHASSSQFCDDHGIIPYGLPSNLTHLLQPLNVCCFQPYKHYHGMTLDRLIRDGSTHIGKLEFLSIIEQVRNETFKEATITSALRKSGIYPLDVSQILTQIADREADKTSSPPSFPSSSEPNTPTTYRQLNRTTSKMERIIGADPNISLGKAELLNRFIKGALFSAAEGIQIKKDLSRTQYAAAVRSQRLASRNQKLRSGSVLEVSQARNMVQRREEDEAIRLHESLMPALRSYVTWPNR